jgi:hypothetical protein
VLLPEEPYDERRYLRDALSAWVRYWRHDLRQYRYAFAKSELDRPLTVNRVLGWVLTGICYSAGFLGVLYLIGRFAQ